MWGKGRKYMFWGEMYALGGNVCESGDFNKIFWLPRFALTSGMLKYLFQKGGSKKSGSKKIRIRRVIFFF